MLRLVRDLLDQQIIDGQGRKVVRVTDVTFRIQHEDGQRSRSTSWTSISDCAACSGVWSRAWFRPAGFAGCRCIIPPHSIRWEHCSILEADPQRRLRLNISNKMLERMHPADLADIVEELSPDDREAIFETIDSEVAAETLSEMEPDVQASILESLETEKAADIVEEMSAARSRRRAGRAGRRDLRRNSRRDGAASPRTRWKNCWNTRKTPPAA